MRSWPERYATPARSARLARNKRCAYRNTMSDDPDEILTPQAAAAELGVDPSTLARWAAAGRVKHTQTAGGWRRYRRRDLAGLIREINPTEETTP